MQPAVRAFSGLCGVARVWSGKLAWGPAPGCVGEAGEGLGRDAAQPALVKISLSTVSLSFWKSTGLLR
jgi:hypothetical protein